VRRSVVADRTVGTWSRAEACQPIDINSLADSRLVCITKADNLGRKLEAHLEQLNPPARISIRVQTYQIAKDLVCSGEGLALIDPLPPSQRARNCRSA